MRILYLHQYFNRPADPGGTRSYEMAKRLVSYGHEVFMITSDHRGLFKRKGWHVTQEAGVEVHWLPVPYNNKMTYPERIKAFFKFAAGAARRAASIPADVVFATSTPLTIAIPGVYTARRQGIPMVFEVRDLWPEAPIKMGALKGPLIPPAKYLEKWAYRNSQQIVTLATRLKDGILVAGYPEHKIHIIPNGCDVNFFKTSKKERNCFRSQLEWLKNDQLVIYTGTIGKINGVEYIAKLAHDVQRINHHIKFLIVGDGIDKKQVIDIARQLGVLNECFFMMHSVPKTEIVPMLSSADIAMSTVINDPKLTGDSANKIFDAFASGTPVAINHRGYMAEILESYEAGIVLSPTNYGKAAQQLVSFLQNKKRLKKAEEAARMLASTKFNRNHLAKQLESILINAVLDFKTKKSRRIK